MLCARHAPWVIPRAKWNQRKQNIVNSCPVHKKCMLQVFVFSVCTYVLEKKPRKQTLQYSKRLWMGLLYSYWFAHDLRVILTIESVELYLLHVQCAASIEFYKSSYQQNSTCNCRQIKSQQMDIHTTRLHYYVPEHIKTNCLAINIGQLKRLLRENWYVLSSTYYNEARPSERSDRGSFLPSGKKVSS